MYERTPMDVLTGEDARIVVSDRGLHYLQTSGKTVTINRYQIFAVAGVGGSSLVYRAVDQQTGNVLFLKEFFPIRFAEDLERGQNQLLHFRQDVPESRRNIIRACFADAFRQELESSEAIRYTGVGSPQITNDDRFLVASTRFSLNGDPTEVFAVIDTGSGETLDKVLDEIKLTGRQRIVNLLQIAGRICTVMGALHSKKRLHLDVSMRNVFLQNVEPDKPGEAPAVVLDFGSCVQFENGIIDLTAGYSPSGSETAPPELIALKYGGNPSQIGPASDTYEIVFLLAQMLSHDAVPSVFDPDATLDYTHSVAFKSLHEIEQSALSELLEKGLDSEPTFRYQTCEALKTELDRLLRITQNFGVDRDIIKKTSMEISQDLERFLPACMLSVEVELCDRTNESQKSV